MHRGALPVVIRPLTMPRFLQFLSSETGRPVFDKTGLAAPTFELRWLPSQAEPQADSPPELFTAIQEQLGLKLEPSRARSKSW
jgi:bla regulator protein BlaR1